MRASPAVPARHSLGTTWRRADVSARHACSARAKQSQRAVRSARLHVVPCGRVADRYLGARIWAEASARAKDRLLAGPVDAGMASALLLAKRRVLSAPDAGPGFGCVAGVSMRERPGPGQRRRVSPTCSFRSHLATSTAGFDLVRRCRFVRPQRLLGCGSRGEAWRGFRRRGWRRCSGSARGLARSRCCFCRWRVA